MAPDAADATEISFRFKNGILVCPRPGESCRRITKTSEKSIRSR
jgi:hypothetical protein